MNVCPACGQGFDSAGFCAVDGTPLITTDDALLGTEIGRYRLARLLGEGGMGRVYLGVQPAIGSRVAIKILSDQCSKTPDLLERFFAEARAVNLIRHEGIVNVLDMAMLPDGRPYIVMEFVEGGTLADALRMGPLPLGGLVQVATEVFSALAAAHAIGIVHRDLKPDNVLVTAEGHAKVLDFGIAKLAPGLQQGVSPRTQTGALLGTPHYMAPEQIQGSGNIDARADIYAAGVMLFEAITGRRPFDGETLYDLMRAHLEQPPPSLRALVPDLPTAIEQVVWTALAKRPADRFQSVTEMSAALNHAAAGLPPEAWRPLSSRNVPLLLSRGGSGSRSAAPSPVSRGAVDFSNRATVPSTPVPTTRRRWPWLVVAGVVVLAIVLLMIFHGSPQPQVVAQAPSDAAVMIAVAPSDAAVLVRAAGEPAPVAPTVVEPEPKPATKPATHAQTPAPTPARPPAPPPPTPDDHGVHIGSNVTIGPNVVIGGGTPPVVAPPPSKFEKPIDYDPKHFDAMAYAPKALALARTVYPDAGFVRFDMVAVYPDGHADLTLTDDSASYIFRSPSHSARPTDVPANLPVEIKCYVEVTVGPKHVEVRARDMDPTDPTCKWPVRHLPTCSMSRVWDAAKLAGAKPNTIAKVEFLEDGKWFFDNEYAGEGIVKSFADCR